MKRVTYSYYDSVKKETFYIDEYIPLTIYLNEGLLKQYEADKIQQIILSKPYLLDSYIASMISQPHRLVSDL